MCNPLEGLVPPLDLDLSKSSLLTEKTRHRGASVTLPPSSWFNRVCRKPPQYRHSLSSSMHVIWKGGPPWALHRIEHVALRWPCPHRFLQPEDEEWRRNVEQEMCSPSLRLLQIIVSRSFAAPIPLHP